MTATSQRASLARYRYPVAALVACLLFGMMELASPWVAGPARVDLNTPLGHLAYQLASQLTPAPSMLRAGTDRRELAYRLFMAGEGSLLAAWVGLLWWRIRPGLARSGRHGNALLGAQLLIALVLDSLAFHFAMATEIAALLPWRRALAWLMLLFALGVGVDAWMLSDARLGLNDASVRALLGVLTLERCLLLLGAALAWLIRQEQRARTALAAANAQLRATQSLLADTVRSSERLRIARDLHDAVGHHLTALKLHLDLAVLDSAGAAPAALATSQDLAQSLLAQVRSVVSAQRQDTRVNLRQALNLLAAGIPHPAIRLAVDSGIEACSPAVAHTLLSCVQEAITNTVRHADASLLTIEIVREGDMAAGRLVDDGRGAASVAEGNGLRGMRERLAAQGGSLAIGKHAACGAQHGFALEFSLPLAGVQA
jgi:two-component system, NarL family, sensor histidine kinase DesK